MNSPAVGPSPTVAFQEMKKQTSSPNLEPKEDSKATEDPRKEDPHQRSPGATHWEGWLNSTSLTRGSRLWSGDYARTTADSMPTCSRQWSWHHHQPAAAVLKTDSRTYTAEMPTSADSKTKCVANGSPATCIPNSTAARRNWRRRLHSSCWLDSQRSSDREEESTFRFISTLLAQVILCHILYAYNYLFSLFVCLLVLQKKLSL